MPTIIIVPLTLWKVPLLDHTNFLLDHTNFLQVAPKNINQSNMSRTVYVKWRPEDKVKVMEVSTVVTLKYCERTKLKVKMSEGEEKDSAHQVE